MLIDLVTADPEGRARPPALAFGCSYSVLKERRRGTLPSGRRYPGVLQTTPIFADPGSTARPTGGIPPEGTARRRNPFPSCGSPYHPTRECQSTNAEMSHDRGDPCPVRRVALVAASRAGRRAHRRGGHPPIEGLLPALVRATGKGSVATCDSSRSVASSSPGC